MNSVMKVRAELARQSREFRQLDTRSNLWEVELLVGPDQGKKLKKSCIGLLLEGLLGQRSALLLGGGWAAPKQAFSCQSGQIVRLPAIFTFDLVEDIEVALLMRLLQNTC